MKITYHIATLKDVSALVEHRMLFALELSGEQKPETMLQLKQQLTDYFSNTVQDQSCISMMATCNGTVAGIGSVHVREMPGNFKNPSGKWGYIMNMYTVPAFRRMGICKTILNKLIEEGKKIGITAFELHATHMGERVYLNEGFAYHSEPTLRKFCI